MNPAQDLDLAGVGAPDGDRPSRRSRRWLPAMLLVAGLVGMLGAGSLHQALRTAPPVPLVRVAVTLALRGVQLDPLPTGVLDVTVDNHDTVPVHLGQALVSGSGVARATTDLLNRDLDVGESARLQVRLPLQCGRFGDFAGAPQLTIDAQADGRTAASVDGVATGQAITDGLCQAASTLPGGWTRPMLARGFLVDGNHATVLLAGLPEGSAFVVTVLADDWALSTQSMQVHQDGTAELTVELMPIECSHQGTRTVLPTGLTIFVSGRVTGATQVYLPIGPDFARWISRAWHAACPGERTLTP